MSARILLALLGFLFGAQPLSAQGFAGLAADATGFALPERGRAFDFPADHGAHPDYRIEWWYLTATLTGADGLDYGIQWTLFRNALRPGDETGWQSPQLWMGHAALTTRTAHHFTERYGRGGIGQAGVRADPFAAWIDEWRMTGQPGRGLSELALHAAGPDFAFDLTLRATGPLVLHGDGGFSVKGAAGNASYYYSQPAYAVTGTLTLPSGPVAVTGEGWLDREWFSQGIAEGQTGWDWFALAFEDGARLMAARMRDAGAGFTAATWIAPDGVSRTLPDGLLVLDPLETAAVAGRDVPVRWRLRLPPEGVDIEVTALNPHSWMGTSIPYWEGPVHVTGSHRGRGYLEMTGYE